MERGPTLSVLIPTRRRADKLAACLCALATQSWQPGDEVVIGFDGADPASEAKATEAFAARGCTLRLERMPREGYIMTRHRLLPTLRGDALVSLNDDVLPAPGFLEAHRRAIGRDGGGAAFVGFSPFARVEVPTMIDRLVAESSWVFFYDRMLVERDSERDWGCRHLFGLNFSVRLDHARAVGGFTAMPDIYGYDDIELGHRLAAIGLAVRFLPRAVALHDHRFTAEGLLARERALGRSAYRYAQTAPAFARDVFGRDILEPSSVAEARSQPIDGAELAAFLALDGTPGGSDHSEPQRLWSRFRGLKRACWAAGFVEAFDQAGDGRAGSSAA